MVSVASKANGTYCQLLTVWLTDRKMAKRSTQQQKSLGPWARPNIGPEGNAPHGEVARSPPA